MPDILKPEQREAAAEVSANKVVNSIDAFLARFGGFAAYAEHIQRTTTGWSQLRSTIWLAVRQEALARFEAATLPQAMREALEARDREYGVCPYLAVNSPPSDALCKVCGADSSEPCRKRVIADGEFVDAARAALALPVPDGWRPIETAPKDGTKFDAWVPDAFGGRRMCNLSFNRRGQLRQDGLLSAADLPRWPTHWRPLPTPPASLTEKEDRT